MSQQHVLRLNAKGLPIAAYQYNSEKKLSQSLEANEWSMLSKKVEWMLILPASWVYLTHTEVPSKNTEVLKQSIPFAVEEELSNEVEDNHFSYVTVSEQKQRVAVLSLNHLEIIKEHVKTYGIKIKGIYSEVDFCPRQKQVVTVWQENEQALLCLGENEAIGIASDQVQSMLPIFATEMDSIQSNLAIDQGWLEGGLNVLKKITLNDCFSTIKEKQSVDVMPVDWLDNKTQQKKGFQKKTLILALILLLSWVGIKSVQHIQVNQQLNNLKTEQLRLFKSRFPDASGSELLDPFAALSSRMKRVNQSQSSTSPFVKALDYLGQVLSVHRQSIDILSLRMVDQKIEVQVIADSMTLINRFQQGLQNAALGFKVMIGVNEQEAGKFKSVITMEQM